MAKLLRTLTHGAARMRIELHLTPDIVAHPPRGRCDALINPGNEEMIGTKLPYFPMPNKPPDGLGHSGWGN